MFVSHRTEVLCAFDEVAAALESSPWHWIPGLVEEPAGRYLCTIAVSPRLSRRAELGVGLPQAGDGWLAVPVSWRAAEADVLFPVFAGEVQARRLPDGRTELALVGSYRPPLGPVGELADQAVMHWVASRALAGFLQRVGELLAGAAGTNGPLSAGTLSQPSAGA